MKARTYRRPPWRGHSGAWPECPELTAEIRDLARGNAKDAMGSIIKVLNDARASASARLAAAGVILRFALDEPGPGAEPDGESDLSRVLREADEISMRRREAARSAAASEVSGDRAPVKY